MIEAHRRLREVENGRLECLYILGERFPDVFLRKFALLDQVIPHVIVLTADILRSATAKEPPTVPQSKNEAWAQAALCQAMQRREGLAVPHRGGTGFIRFLATELLTSEGTTRPERLDILGYDRVDHALVALEIKGPDAKRVEVENLFLQGIEHRNWLERNKMAIKLMFDGPHGKRINTRKRVRLLLGSFEERVPLLFDELRPWPSVLDPSFLRV